MEVRFLEVASVQPERLALWESWLAPEKRQRLSRLPERGRLLSLCGDGLAREMLGEKLGKAAGSVKFSYTKNGKPLSEGAYFSVSHSGGTVVCVVAETPIGVDVEQIRPVPPHLGEALAGSWTTEEEFWKLWTTREAIIKCRGGRLWDWKTVRETQGRIIHPEYPGYAVTICEEA